MLKKIVAKLARSISPSVITEPSNAHNINIPLLYPLGHFYSPIADPVDIRTREARIWMQKDEMPGISMDLFEQLALLDKLKPYTASIDYPIEQPADVTSYFYQNDMYPVLDAEVLFTMLCYLKPSKVIEVGSGFSSLITADVNRRLLGGQLDFCCVEPFPRQFLIDGVEGITQLVQQKVEDVELLFFEKLEANDILFIDSSHVSKVGSDVNYLFFEVLPRLKKGVLVHFHDIFLPDEYPQVWAITEGRNWNEQYLLRAFLQFNVGWKVVWASHFMGTRHTTAVQGTFPRYPKLGGGGSFWIQRV